MNKKIKNLFIAATTGFLLSLLFHTYIGEFTVYYKNNMIYSLKPGSLIFVNKLDKKTKIGELVAYQNNNSTYIARTSAYQNDKVQIFKADFYQSGNKIENKLRRYFIYRIFSTESIKKELKKSKIYFTEKNNNGLFYYYATLRPQNQQTLKKNKKVVFIQRVNQSFSPNDENIDFFSSEKSKNEHDIFVLNDLRNDLRDSRTFGYIQQDSIIGKVIKIF